MGGVPTPKWDPIGFDPRPHVCTSIIELQAHEQRLAGGGGVGVWEGVKRNVHLRSQWSSAGQWLK